MNDWHLQSFCLTPRHANRGKRIGLSFCIKRGTGLYAHLSSTTTGSASPSRWDLRLCVLVLQQSDNYGYRIIQDTAAGPTEGEATAGVSLQVRSRCMCHQQRLTAARPDGSLAVINTTTR